MSTQKANLVIIATYRIHPEDMTRFIEIVRPHLKGTQDQPGCVYYTFSVDLLDNNLCHLAEGWVDHEAYLLHEEDPAFQQALRKVDAQIRILNREAVMYTVSGEGPIVPVRQPTLTH